MHHRPAFLRHTEVVRIIDLGMWLVLIGGACLMVNSCPRGMGVGGAIVLCVLVFDFLTRAILREVEIRRIRKRNPKMSHQEAKEHVRQRVRSLLSP
jgi:hypothetical protein